LGLVISYLVMIFYFRVKRLRGHAVAADERISHQLGK
jgi:hypothetical protein